MACGRSLTHFEFVQLYLIFVVFYMINYRLRNQILYPAVRLLIYIILVCFRLSYMAILFICQNRPSMRRSKLCTGIENLTNSHEKIGSKRTNVATERICSSLSCVRCSNTLYSADNLLNKWCTIERQYFSTTDQRTRERIRKGILDTSKRREGYKRSQQEPTVFCLEGLPCQVWYDLEDHSSEVSILQDQNTLDFFKEEFTNAFQDLNAGWVSNKVASGGWYLFYFINQGVKNNENCLKCPRSIKTIESLKTAMLDCAFGNVLFSILLPGTKIAGHCGPTNARIRCHVPLQIPKGFFISVAGEEKTWQEGRTLIFDDSYYHKVYCHGSITEPRVVLMIDLWHPALLLSEQEMIKKLFPPQE